MYVVPGRRLVRLILGTISMTARYGSVCSVTMILLLSFDQRTLAIGASFRCAKCQSATLQVTAGKSARIHRSAFCLQDINATE